MKGPVRPQVDAMTISRASPAGDARVVRLVAAVGSCVDQPGVGVDVGNGCPPASMRLARHGTGLSFDLGGFVVRHSACCTSGYNVPPAMTRGEGSRRRGVGVGWFGESPAVR